MGEWVQEGPEEEEESEESENGRCLELVLVVRMIGCDVVAHAFDRGELDMVKVERRLGFRNEVVVRDTREN